jgi:hypothetical protein
MLLCADPLTARPYVVDGFRESIGAYFADLAETSVKSLSDVIAYDQANSDICLSGKSPLQLHR